MKKAYKHDAELQVVNRSEKPDDLDRVLLAVVREYGDYGITEDDVLSRRSGACDARAVAMSVLKQDFRWEYAKIGRYFNADTSAIVEEFNAIDWLERTPFYIERLGRVRRALKAGKPMDSRAAATSLSSFVAPIRRAVEAAADAYGVALFEMLSEGDEAATSARVLASYSMRRYLMMRYVGIGHVLGCTRIKARELCEEGLRRCDDGEFAKKASLVRDSIDEG